MERQRAVIGIAGVIGHVAGSDDGFALRYRGFLWITFAKMRSYCCPHNQLYADHVPN